MIPGWYGMLKRSGLYRAFLRHRVWTAKAIQSAHILYSFPLGALPLVWVFGPVVLLIIGWLLFYASLAQLTMMGPSVTITGICSVLIAYCALLAPIVVTALLDMFRGYFAGMSALFGHPAPALSLQRDTLTELNDWNRQYG